MKGFILFIVIFVVGIIILTVLAVFKLGAKR